MTLSLFSDYSLRVLMFAALPGRASFSLDEVAERYAISRHHVVKVVNFLAHAGYLHTQRGRGGGITLAVPAETVRLGQVVRRTETGPPLVECLDAQSNTCPVSAVCRLKGILAEAQNAFFSSLDRHTLADLVTRPQLFSAALK